MLYGVIVYSKAPILPVFADKMRDSPKRKRGGHNSPPLFLSGAGFGLQLAVAVAAPNLLALPWPGYAALAAFAVFSSFSSASCRMKTGMQMASPTSPLVSPGMIVSKAPIVHSQRSQLFMPTSM